MTTKSILFNKQHGNGFFTKPLQGNLFIYFKNKIMNHAPIDDDNEAHRNVLEKPLRTQRNQVVNKIILNENHENSQSASQPGRACRPHNIIEI